MKVVTTLLYRDFVIFTFLYFTTMDIQIKYGLEEIFIYKPIHYRLYNELKDRFLKNTLMALDYLYFKDIMMVTYHKNSPQEMKVDIIDRLIDYAPESIVIEFGETNQYFPNSNTMVCVFEKNLFMVMYKYFIYCNLQKKKSKALQVLKFKKMF